MNEVTKMSFLSRKTAKEKETNGKRKKRSTNDMLIFDEKYLHYKRYTMRKMSYLNGKPAEETNEERKKRLTNDMLVFVEKNLHDEPRIHKIVNEIISCSECILDRYNDGYGISFELPTVKLKFTTENEHGKDCTGSSLTIFTKEVPIERGEDRRLTHADIFFRTHNDSYTFALSGWLGYDCYPYCLGGVYKGEFREDGETIIKEYMNVYNEEEFNEVLDFIKNELDKYNEKDNVM